MLSHALRSSFAQAVLGYAKKGVRIHYFCGNAYTEDGGRLMDAIGMKRQCPHVDSGQLFRGKATVMVRKILEDEARYRPA
jgi:hypothetical protein